MICLRCNEYVDAPGEVDNDCMRWRSNKRERVCVEREVSFASDMVKGDGSANVAPTQDTTVRNEQNMHRSCRTDTQTSPRSQLNRG